MIKNYTIKQLIIAAGLTRKLDRKEICRIADCVNSYITYVTHTVGFNEIQSMFDHLPYDKDTKEYKGLGTILMDIARLLYNLGEKSE